MFFDFIIFLPKTNIEINAVKSTKTTKNYIIRQKKTKEDKINKKKNVEKCFYLCYT